MATEGSIVTKDWEPAARAFVQQANAAQLRQIAGGTALARDPLVANPKGDSEQQTAALRKLIRHHMKRHADFRGMVIRVIAQAGLVPPPVKGAKQESPAAAGKEAAPAGEKKPKKEKGGEKPPAPSPEA